MTDSLPSYYPLQTAQHHVFEEELRGIITSLPFCSGDRVLDMGCGDGFFSRWLAQTVRPQGRITAVDVSTAYLILARNLLKGTREEPFIQFLYGDIKRLPFKAESFDAAWCAESFCSFPDPQKALKELTRVVRPGGTVSVIETDTLHHVLFPWPIEVELAVARAEYQCGLSKTGTTGKYYMARKLRQLFTQAGLRPQRKKIFPMQREIPFNTKETRYLSLYLQDLKDRLGPFMTSADKKRVMPYLKQESPLFLLKQAELTFTLLEHVIWGKKPF